IRPDVLHLLEDLRSSNVKLGLISNCMEEEVMSWEDSELAKYFDARIFSYEVKCCKPDARIYLLACESLEVNPEESVFVGDGGSDELRGAERAGLTPYHAFWFNKYVQSNYTKLETPSDLMTKI